MPKRSHLLILLITTCLLIFSTAAYTFAESEQEIVARNFLQFVHSDKVIQSVQILARNSLDSSAEPIPVAYLFQLNGGGYILVADSQDLTPIKAYSLTNDFEALPPAYQTALLNELEALVRSQAVDAGRMTQSDAAVENRRRWDFLLTLNESRLPLAYMPDTYLLSAIWKQSAPYNKYLPEINGQKTITGCVNTAIGQIMKYHGYPLAGRGVVSYTWNGQPLKAVLYHPYNWANMPDKLTSDTPEYQTDEVARFMRDIGIANHTDYGVGVSGASLNGAALIENFGYSSTIQHMYNTNVDAFFATLKSEIDAGRPVYLAFPGHAVVADGYASDGAGRKIHVNMGWQRSYNDYYYLDQTVLAGDKTYFTGPGNLQIDFNIKPCDGGDCAEDAEIGDVISNLSISGNFNYTYDADRYTLYLKGNTTLKAYRHYENIAFRITLYDAAGNEAWVFTGAEEAAPSVHSQYLPAGKYTLEVALGGFTYSEIYKHYTITLTTESITPEERATIDADADMAPVIYNDFPYMFLNSQNAQPDRLLIDARDENGDAVKLQVKNSNPSAVTAALSQNILELTPVAGAVKIAAKITVKATANGKTAEKTFVVLVSNEDAGFGKSFEVEGLFENQNDFNQHKVILGGVCQISGSNGYSSQAFYSSVLDDQGNQLIPAGSSTITSSFTGNVYWLGASLNLGGSGSYFPYQLGMNDQYRFTVSCPDADDRVTTIADLLGVDLSGTEPQKGDVNGDGTVNLTDAVLIFRILSRVDTTGSHLTLDADATGDGRLGMAEVIYLLQKVGGIR